MAAGSAPRRTAGSASRRETAGCHQLIEHAPGQAVAAGREHHTEADRQGPAHCQAGRNRQTEAGGQRPTRRQTSESVQPKPAEKAEPAVKPAENTKPKPSAKPPERAEPTPGKSARSDDRHGGGPFRFVSFLDPSVADDPTESPTAKDKPAAGAAPAAKATVTPPADKESAATPVKPAATAPAPIFVMPGDGTVTVFSDDPEALEQFELLLRTLGPVAPTGDIGRNMSMFPLKYSDAAEVADKLQALFTTGRSSWRRGSTALVIVPDERLNTIMVQGSRIDRETVGNVIRVLDSNLAEASKPKFIPLHNTDAKDIVQVVRDVFRSQLTARTRSGAGASVSRRLEPSVTADELTNSLIVMAPAPLQEEIAEFANHLDQAADETPGRRLQIIPLAKLKATRVEEALQRILNSRASPRRTR